VPGFPSLFLMYGPNTNASGSSIIVYEEAQAAYVRQALQHVRERGAAAIDVRPEVEAESDRRVQARFAGTAWTRCDSWYHDATGRTIRQSSPSCRFPSGRHHRFPSQDRELEPSSSGEREVSDVAARVGIRMVEGVHRVGGLHIDSERVAAALVLDGDEDTVRPRVPEQRHLDAVVAPAIQLAGPDLGCRAHDFLVPFLVGSTVSP
jgi:hypothetical protein